LLLLSALAMAAFQAPAGAARTAHERSPEEQAAAVSSREAAQAQRAEQIAAQKAEAAAELQAARAQQRAAQGQGGAAAGQTPAAAEPTRSVQNSSRARTHGNVQFSCEQVSWTFTGFHPGSNTVKHVVTVRNVETNETLKLRGSTTFDGEEGKSVTPLELPPGTYKLDAWAKWKGNGLKGSFDILGRVSCSPTPGFSIEKLQKIAGSGSFTKSTLMGNVGETVEYEIVLHNSGNVPLSFEPLVDSNCDEGTVSGGPGTSPLAPGASATYMCTHVLSAGDRAAGSHSNSARTTGAPPPGDGNPITHTSNTVVVTVAPAAPAFSIEKLQRIAGSGSFTTQTLSGQVGQTVEYEVVVKNTGNVTLTMSGFADANCDPGTIGGGPAGGVLAAGASATYTCSHQLSEADLTVGSYSNTAGVTGTPPPGAGEAITHTSNTVVVTVSPSSPGGGGNGGSGGSSSSTPGGGVLSSTVTQPPTSGVLAAALASVPRLRAPQGCVRTRFRVSIKSAGVHSVTFYLDGHKLKTLTYKNAHSGLLSLQIDPSKWKVGVHRVLAKITMTAPGATKAKTASRTARVVRCRPAVLTPKFTG
jgi:hypothetical protein